MASKRFDLSVVQYFWTNKAKEVFKHSIVQILCAKEILVCKCGNRRRQDRGKVINRREKPGKTVY
jgi:hypothetical protein